MNNPTATRAIAYTRISKQDSPDDPSVSPAAQEAAIREYAEREGMEIVAVFHEPPGAGGSNMKRPYLQAALSKMATGEVAEALICARLDRFGRSVADIGKTLELAADEDWALILLDVQIDTRTPEGEHFAFQMASFGQLERKRIGQRTRAVLKQKKREGVKLGRPRTVRPATVARIKNLRGPADNPKRTPYRIAKDLNARGVTTDTGAEWTPAAVKRVLSYAA
ncbi:MAG TPA: recombinase family protein [Solirubrobacterales bacterium]|nr:recombinase family protein [Solirubrobacterales bacterium]